MSGGTLVAQGDEPSGARVSTLKTGECRDARGGRVPGPDAEVHVVRRRDQRLVVVEYRQGDRLVVDNQAERAGERVFQAILERSSGVRTLREYRLPLDGNGPGSLAVATSFRKRDQSEGFVAEYRAPAMTCPLEVAILPVP